MLPNGACFSIPRNELAMRRIGYVLAVSAIIGACALAAVAQEESLGDAARAARKEKRPPAKMVYTNDNLPTTTVISVVGPPPTATEEKPAAQEMPAAKPQDEKEKVAENESQKDSKTSESKTAENKTPQTEQEWQYLMSAQKKKIADLEHELDLEQREYKLQVAQYYADAGTQLRDQKDWADREVKFRADITDKQKQIDDAKAGLKDMEEQQRQQDGEKTPLQ